MTDKKLTKNTITILGSGTSTGVPIIRCQCVVCLSLDPRDKRLRTSIYLETKAGNKILVDTGPDLRQQVLQNNICEIDFTIITHEHADHLHGLDDLRPFSFTLPPRSMPVYCSKETLESIKTRFSYVFPREERTGGGGIPRLNFFETAMNRSTLINGEEFYFFENFHGHNMKTLAFIHEKFAYIIDCVEISESVLEELAARQLDFLLIDCLQRKPQGTHLFVERTFEYIKKIKAKKTGLIHISHDLSHKYLERIASEQFGPEVFPVYDGLKISY